MDFSLDEDQLTTRTTVRSFLESIGSTRVARRYMDGGLDAMEQVWAGLTRLGVGSVLVPEDQGGLGLGLVSTIPVMEELGRGLVPGPLPETYVLAATLVGAAGGVALRRAILSGIANGSVRATLCFAASDEGTASVRATDDRYVLSGRGLVAWHGTEANWLIVPARLAGAGGASQSSAFLVDSRAAGVAIARQRALDETRSLARVDLAEVAVDRDARLGGPADYEAALDAFRAALSSMMVGSMERVVELCVEHANLRQQFGQPIGRFQAIKHRIVDLMVMKETARSLAYDAALARDEGRADAAVAASAAKSYASESFSRVAAASVQIHGGIGFTWESDAHLYLKRAKAWESYAGSPAQCRERIATALAW